MMLPAVAALVLLHVGAAESAGLVPGRGAADEAADDPDPAGIRARRLAHRLAVAGCAPAAARHWARSCSLLPFAMTGALPNMWLAFGSFYARRDILSGNAANVWWIANYASAPGTSA